MAMTMRIIPLYWLEQDENRGSFRADETDVESNKYLSELNTKMCVEKPDPLWTAMSWSQEQGENANREKIYDCTSKSKTGRREGSKGVMFVHFKARKEAECVLFFLF